MKKSISVEQKFIKFKVLGFLASREKINSKYTEKMSHKETIKDFFIRCEKITNKEWEKWEKKYNEDIKRIPKLATKDRKEGFGSRETFLEWYLMKEKKCCYCGIKEEYLIKYFNNDNKQYFRNENDQARKRGKVLEIERIVTDGETNNLYTPENTDLACYICNNAKSDFISAKDFKPIAEGINNFWRNKEIPIDDFDVNAKIWGKE